MDCRTTFEYAYISMDGRVYRAVHPAPVGVHKDTWKANITHLLSKNVTLSKSKSSLLATAAHQPSS
jgi:hypothetical protein